MLRVRLFPALLGLIGSLWCLGLRESEAGVLVIAESGEVATATAALNGRTILVTLPNRVVGYGNATVSNYHVVNTGPGNLTATLSSTGTTPITGFTSPRVVVAGTPYNPTLTLAVGSTPGAKMGALEVTRSGDLKDTLKLQTTVFDHSSAAFDAAGATTLTIDFGALGVGQISDPAIFTILNNITTPYLTAGLDLLSITPDPASDYAMFGTTVSTFENLYAGNFIENFAWFAPTADGIFEATYTLHFSDDHTLPGATTKDLTLILQGTAFIRPDAVPAPEPSSLLVMGGALGLTFVGLRRRGRS